jgi:hypothetical protein
MKSRPLTNTAKATSATVKGFIRRREMLLHYLVHNGDKVAPKMGCILLLLAPCA